MDIDAPGALSIVVQGAVDASRIALVAHNCAHWRRLFPSAQLICAASASDAAPAARSLDDGDDARAIIAACDAVVFAPSARVLPPIKTDARGDNHVNLMIAAARAGLAEARGRHVLRIRNDLAFADRTFLAAYAACRDVPRGDRAVFEQRVLASEIFTLNPFTVSRMPFHVSDWFHFGLTRDVRAIWDAAECVTTEDAAYYASAPHRPGSKAVERRFLVRRASEQCVHFPVLRHAFPDLVLDLHNDMTSSETALFALADNFGLANMAACGATLPRYQDVIDRMSPFARLECLSQAQLRRRAIVRDMPGRQLFASEIAQVRRFETLSARARRAVRRRFRRWQQGAIYRRWRFIRAGVLRRISGR